MKVDFKFKWLKCHLLMVDINIPMSLSGESESGESWISSNIRINTQLQWRGKPRMFQPVKGWNKWHKLNLLSDKIDCSIEAWAESNNWLLRERSEKKLVESRTVWYTDHCYKSELELSFYSNLVFGYKLYGTNNP